jgi:transmembrane sensor
MTVGEGDNMGGTAGREPVLARLQPRWSSDRTEDNLAVAFRRIERRRLVRAGMGGVLALGAVALVVAWTVRRAPPAAPIAHRVPVVAPAGPTLAEASAKRLVLPDGSTIELGDARARARVSGASPERIDVDLSDGPATFQVRTHAQRTVVVHVARVEVSILGARFELAPAGDHVNVTVADGEVEVSWPGGQATVKGGEAVVFPPVAPSEISVARGTSGRARFRSQIARRDYAGAYRSLVATPDVAEHSAEDLMLAADAARLSGHPASAVPYLRHLLLRYPTDVRVPVAAFTLGRVLLAELERPAEAADAFALSYRVAPTGPLAADALGREVEAAARAGDAARAHRLATTYVARYPKEPRVAAVRRAGGLGRAGGLD